MHISRTGVGETSHEKVREAKVKEAPHSTLHNKVENLEYERREMVAPCGRGASGASYGADPLQNALMRDSPRTAVARFAAACRFFYLKDKNGKGGGRAWLTPADMAGAELDRASGAAESRSRDAIARLPGTRSGRSPMTKDRLSGYLPLARFLAVNRGPPTCPGSRRSPQA
jgi:hypothetical protein